MTTLVVSVIIVNYNVQYFLEQCLFSVRAALKDIESEVIVVDNASMQIDKNYFDKTFPEVQFIYNGDNTGFGAANNQGVAVATGSYLLLLNPDTLIAEDTILQCIQFLKSKDDNGALGVRMIDAGGRFLKESKRAFPDPVTSFYKLSGLAALFPRSARFARYYLGHLSEYKNSQVDVLAGAFIFLSKKVFDRVDGFDEDFFMYAEDVDLSYRIQKAGFLNYYFAGTTIIHFKGESTRMNSAGYVKMFYGAMMVFIKKHYRARRAVWFTGFLRAGILIRGGIALVVRFLRRTIHTLNQLFLRGKRAVTTTIIVAGTSGECDEAQNILTQNGRTATIPVVVGEGMAGTEVLPAEDAVGRLLKNNHTTEVVFCQGSISFKQIIGEVINLAGRCKTGFFVTGARRIIRSNRE